jgi:hypothetical protein
MRIHVQYGSPALFGQDVRLYSGGRMADDDDLPRSTGSHSG